MRTGLRRPPLAAAMIATAVALAGCGGGGNDADGSSTSAAATTTASESTDAPADASVDPMASDDAASLGAALLSAGAALLDSDELLPPQAARASAATPSTAADLRTVVRFMQSPWT